MMSKPYFILSLDGGGIRGLVTALILQKLEAKIQQHSPGKKLKDCFNLIAGTSTGSLIACGLSHGRSIDEIVNFYELESNYPQKIFPKSQLDLIPKSKVDIVIRAITNLVSSGYSQPMYDGKGLEEVLKEIFEKNTFKQLKIQTLVTSYDVYNGQAIVFNSKQDECETLPIWEVCRASAAAPVAFPAHILTDKTFLTYWKEDQKLKLTDSPDHQQKCIPLIDGGVAASNPTLCAVAEAIKGKNNLSDLVVASFGSGEQETQSMSVKDSRKWGAWEWINPFNDLPIFETFNEGSSDVIDHITKSLVSHNYYRFQPYFEEKISTFQATPENINAIKQETSKYLNSPDIQERLNRLAVQLTSTAVSLSVEREKELAAVSSLN
ncbi:MAG: patatin-like phospholipase family protein [Lyngbya sp.]|nr:patatin-like phospholipase family protein [Lyngbya sp.]